MIFSCFYKSICFVCRDCTVHEALTILEEDTDLEPKSIFIEPPQPTIHSDEDSGDEDQGGFINNLSSRQLNAGCQVVLAIPIDRKLRRSQRQHAKYSTSSTRETEISKPSSSRGHDSSVGSGRGHASISGERQHEQGRSGGRRGSQSRSAVNRVTKRAPSDDSNSVSSMSNEEDEEEKSTKKNKNYTKYGCRKILLGRYFLKEIMLSIGKCRH